MRFGFLVISMVFGLLFFGCGASDDNNVEQEENPSQNRAYVLQVLSDNSVPFGAVLHSRDLDGNGKDYSIELSFNYDKTDPQKVESLKSMLYTNEDGEWFYGEYKNGLPSLLVNSEKIYKYGSYTDNSFILSEFDENNINIKNTLIKSVKFVNMDDVLRARGLMGFLYKIKTEGFGKLKVNDVLGFIGDGVTLFTACFIPDPTFITKAICVSSLSASAIADLKDMTSNKKVESVSMTVIAVDLHVKASDCVSALSQMATLSKVKMAKAALDCASYGFGIKDFADFAEREAKNKTLNQINKENNITSTKKPVITDLSPLFEITDTGEVVLTQPESDLTSGVWNVSDNYTVSAYSQMNGNIMGEKITTKPSSANYKVDIGVAGNIVTYQYSMNNITNILQGTSTGGNSILLKGINQNIPAVGGSYQGMVVKENKIELTLTFVDATHMKANGLSEVVLELCNSGVCTSTHTETTSVATLTKQ